MKALEACTSAVDLAHLAGAELPSPTVETCLDAIAAVAPTDAELVWWKRVSKQRWPSRRMRRVLACIGRRGLKTSGLLAWQCVFETLCGGHERFAAPGSRIYALVICPTLAQSREALRGIKGVLDALAPLGVRYDMRDAGGSPEIVIVSPACAVERVIAVQSADSVSVRSRAIFFLGLDEAGFLPSSPWLSEVDADIVRAARAGMIQFEHAIEVWTSSPGAPQGEFYKAVTSPGPNDVLIRAPTWIMNPRIGREKCHADANGDEHFFRQEFAAEVFGYRGDNFLDVSKVALGDKYTDLGPRPGSFVVALDYAPLHDDTAIGAFSSFEIEIAPHVPGVRHVVCEFAEVIGSSREHPTSIEEVAVRAAQISKLFGNAPIVFDQFCAPQMKAELLRLGYREHTDDARVPPPRTFMQMSMAAHHQTPRWRLVAQLTHSARLHLATGHDELRRQLGQLKATQLDSGALKVEGKRDDLADVLALGAWIAVRLPPTNSGDAAQFRYDGVLFDKETRSIGLENARWVKDVKLRDGTKKEVPVEVPTWSPQFEEHARECVKQGIWTPAVRAWFDALPEETQRELRPIEPETHIVNAPIIGG